MIFLPNFNDTLIVTNSTGFNPKPSDTYVENNGSNSDNNNGFLVAIEVIFSLLVLFILLFCFISGLRKKRRIRKEREEIIQAAIEEQRRIQQMQCNSTVTVTTLIQCPPPCYSPPDPNTRLSNDVISRIDQLLIENQIASASTPLNRTLPKYSEL